MRVAHILSCGAHVYYPVAMRVAKPLLYCVTLSGVSIVLVKVVLFMSGINLTNSRTIEGACKRHTSICECSRTCCGVYSWTTYHRQSLWGISANWWIIWCTTAVSSKSKTAFELCVLAYRDRLDAFLKDTNFNVMEVHLGIAIPSPRSLRYFIDRSKKLAVTIWPGIT